MDRPISSQVESIDLASEPPFKLGGGRVDPQALDYIVQGETFRLQPQTLKVLVALHHRTGHVVTRDQLIERCWDGRIVGDDVINRAISLLRPLAARSGEFSIETVPRSGYRLVERPAGANARLAPRWIVGIALLLVVALAGAAIFVTHRARTNYGRTLVVGVMPFSAQSGGNAASLAADTQDSVVRMLTESGLSVKLFEAARSSDRDAADFLVSGFVSADPRGAAVMVRIEYVKRHAIVLSRRLESGADHAADLPDRVGANVASALSWIGPLILSDERHPSDPAFISQLLDTQSTGLAGYEFARRNAPNAPNSAIAQFMFALDTMVALVDIPKEQRPSAVTAALAAADRASQLAPDYGDVYVPWCGLHSPTLIKACEDRLRTGLTRGTQAPFIAVFLSELMNRAGRTEDAVSLANAALAEDRYVSYKLGLVIELDEAVGRGHPDTLYAEAVRLWPEDVGLFWRRAQGILKRGDFKALEQFERDVGTKNFPPDYHSSAAVGHALSTRSTAEFAVACPATAQGIQAIQCMIAASLMGNLDQAFVFAATLYPRTHGRTPAESDAIWLEYPFAQDTAYLSSPATVAMRRDPRFLAVVDRVGLLDYWRSGRMPDFCTKSHEEVCGAISGNSH